MSLNCTNGVYIIVYLFYGLYISGFLSNIASNSFYESKRKNEENTLKLSFIGGVIGLFPRLAAQNITFKHLSTDNYLSQISVNDIYVDENNLIWIGTREGLNCYDGNDITIYRLEKDNPYSLFSNHLLRITGDGKDIFIYYVWKGGQFWYGYPQICYTTQWKSGCHYLSWRALHSVWNEVFLLQQRKW